MQFNNKEYNIKIWNGEFLGSLVAVDTETDIQPFTSTPDLILGSAYGGGETIFIIDSNDVGRFIDKHRSASFIFHNAPFDMDVLKKKEKDFDYYRWYDSHRVLDTSVLYRLLGLAEKGWVPKKFSLALLCKELLEIELEKGEERVTFEQFKGMSAQEIPGNYLEYAAKDALATYACYWELRKHIAKYDTKKTLLSHHIQAKGDLALSHIYKRGVGFDLRRRDIWLKAAQNKLTKIQHRLATWGWARGVKGNKEEYEYILDFLGIKDLLPHTEDGSVSSKADDLEPYRHMPFINDYLNYSELEKLTTFVRDQDEPRIHPKYNLLMNTGRTSCTKPNIQQLPRSGVIRSMYTAEKNHSLIITDYTALELATLSQVLKNRYGYSVMADKINQGEDLHTYYASVLHNIDQKDVTKAQRQEAKAANFGFPGGLGLDTFIQFSEGYGLSMDRKQAGLMKDAWFAAFPEMKRYLRETQEGMVYTETGRARGNAFYCAAANTPFQGLAADGAKLALYELDKQGLNVVAFVHDEIVIEELDCDIEEARELLEQAMIKGMQEVVPDVAIRVDSQVSKRYCK